MNVGVKVTLLEIAAKHNVLNAKSMVVWFPFVGKPFIVQGGLGRDLFTVEASAHF